jgi:hypothetical protein
MQEGIELVLKPGINLRNCCAVIRAIITWYILTRRVHVSQQLHLIIKGGPCLAPETREAYWLGMVPLDAVDRILIDGKTWTMDGPVPCNPTAAEVEMPAETAQEQYHA